ncbi:ATP-dependent Clp protease adapter ClpS [Schaalia sp. lx-260]|uniref:ATP-dependent Clp protease adapter ClpS n=1 Tax=Schaalia sp. lx-260 TaxID=2899082 RepID=UPI001E4D0E1E|nr:ATP-dependent Clp protease adapter ClpS [Schaalia sp. lx-260]MCD4550284.1 ATP-dependent Clp protease adapter ClpS [Schaalia sp. lx-260]
MDALTHPTSSPEGAVFTQWCLVVWNDPVNLMDYVTQVFMRHFSYSRAHSEKLMREVHRNGHAVVNRGVRERVEADALALHGYGLRATVERNE